MTAATATRSPTSWAVRKPGTDDGAMPANVSLKARPTVTAGFANDVDEVHQYAAPMYAPTAQGITVDRPPRTSAKISTTSPAVATTSDSRSQLRRDVHRELSTCQPARRAATQPPVGQGHDGVEVRPGHRGEDQDEHRQPTGRRQRVLQQAHAVVRGQVLRGDARAHDDSDEQAGTDELRRGATGELAAGQLLRRHQQGRLGAPAPAASASRPRTPRAVSNAPGVSR